MTELSYTVTSGHTHFTVRILTCVEYSLLAKIIDVQHVHREPKKHTKMFLSYLPQNPVDSDKISYTLFRINLRYSSLNVLQLTWIMWLMSLHYTLWNLALRVVSEQQLELRTLKHIKCFVTSSTKQADYDNILCLLSWIYFSQSMVNVFRLA